MNNNNDVTMFRHDIIRIGKKKGPFRSLAGNKRAIFVVLVLVAGFAIGWLGSSQIQGPSPIGAGDGTDLGPEAVEQIVIDFLDARLSQSYPGIEVVSEGVAESTEIPGTYEVTIKMTFQGQPQSAPYHVTKDGKWMFGGLLDLDEQLPDVAPPVPSGGDTGGQAIDMVAVMDDDEVKGDPNAPVTIVEFSDFECPYCTRFFTQTLPAITEQYIDTGKVKFVYRDFPLSFHPNAQKAAEAAECAADQDKFWDMHDKLFEDGVKGGVNSFKQYAAELGLDTAAFDECLDSGKYTDEVQKDLADGSRLGVSGTPGFFVNGKYVNGAQPFEVFQQAIEAELGG
jgi:protein-disulfide isomerase